MKEEFRIIPGTNELYEVSNLGNVKRVVSFVNTNSSGTAKREVGGNVLRPKTKSNGYQEVNLHLYPQKGTMFYVHRLVVSAFISEIPKGYTVNHKDGNKANNVLSNLEIATYSENINHSFRELGRKVPCRKGENSNRSILKESDVIEIRNLFDSGLKIADIIKNHSYPVGRSGIERVCLRKTWNHI